MSGRQFFADIMLEQIALERRLAEISANAAAYEANCIAIRQEHLPRLSSISVSFHKANEGLCAVNKILAHGTAKF